MSSMMMVYISTNLRRMYTVKTHHARFITPIAKAYLRHVGAEVLAMPAVMTRLLKSMYRNFICETN